MTDRIRPAAEHVCECGHFLWLHGTPDAGGTWGACKGIEGSPSRRCQCSEAWPLTDQPRPCSACWMPALDNNDLCAGHHRLAVGDASATIAPNN